MSVELANDETVQHDLPKGTAYAGFWVRFLAVLIDTLLLMACSEVWNIVSGKGLFAGFETTETIWRMEDTISMIAVFAVTVAFWHKWQATPGKMLLRLKIVDSRTGGRADLVRLIIRALGQYLSAVVLCLGYLWVAWDPKKQGWHDKMASTLVVRLPKPDVQELKLP